MTKKEFGQAIVEMLNAMMPGYDVELRDIDKANQKLMGIVFRKHGSNVAPTLYVEDYYSEDVGCLSDIAEEMVESVYTAMENVPDMEGNVKNYNIIKENLGVRVLDLERNKEYAADKLYKDLGNGLGLFADIRFPEGDGFASAVVADSLLDKWNISEDTFWEDVMASAANVVSPTFINVESMMFGNGTNLLDEPDEDAHGKMYVLSSNGNTLGASSLFLPNIAEKVCAILGGEYYALPSSVHEFIIVPEDAGVSVDELKQMVREANRSVVEDKDVLIDNVFRFNAWSGQVEVA